MHTSFSNVSFDGLDYKPRRSIFKDDHSRSDYSRFGKVSFFDSESIMSAGPKNWRFEEKGEEFEFPTSSVNWCLNARTSFLLPYQWSSREGEDDLDKSKKSISQYVNSLTNRKLMDPEGGNYLQLWKEKTSLPHSVQDLVLNLCDNN